MFYTPCMLKLNLTCDITEMCTVGRGEILNPKEYRKQTRVCDGRGRRFCLINFIPCVILINIDS